MLVYFLKINNKINLIKINEDVMLVCAQARNDDIYIHL